MARVSSTEELRTFWNEFRDRYIANFQEIATAIYNILLPLCKVSTATKIVEAGCGAGNGVSILRSIIPETVEILANDISETLLEVGRSRNLPNVQWLNCSNEELPYADSLYDRYIANLSLHIVENPQKMAQEAFRVLQSGGRASFSVWGKPQPNNLFFICGKYAVQAGHTPATRSMFHLKEEEDLRRLVEDAGFKNVLCVASCTPFGFTNVEEAMVLAKNTPLLIEMKEVSEEIFQTAVGLISEEIEKVFTSGHPLVFDCLIATGVKP